MSRFFVRLAAAEDNDELCALSRVPMAGAISLALERYPDYFASSSVQNEDAHVVVVCDRNDNDRIAGVAGLGRRNVFVDGSARPVRYLSDVRVLPVYRGLRPLKLFNDYVREQELRQPSRTMQSIVFSENRVYRELLKRAPATLERLRYLRYYELGDFRTSAISLKGRKRAHTPTHRVRRATAADASTMQRFFDAEAPRRQFYPAYRFDRLDTDYCRDLAIDDFYLAFDSDRLVGITGIWDQSAFKQTRIAGYLGVLGWARPLANLVSVASTGFSLPPAGSELHSFYLHTILAAHDNRRVFDDLLECIYADHRRGRYDYFLCGMFTHDPLLESVNRFRNRRDMFGKHYEVAAEAIDTPIPRDAPMYLEAARI